MPVTAEAPEFTEEQIERAARMVLQLDGHASRWATVNRASYRKEAKSILDAAFSSATLECVRNLRIRCPGGDNNECCLNQD